MRLTDKQRLEVEYNMGKHDGIKEVVEWLRENGQVILEGHRLLDYLPQAKLKEWD